MGSLRRVRVSFGPHLALVQIQALISFWFSMFFFPLHVSAQRHDGPVNLSPAPAVPDGGFPSNGRGDGTLSSEALHDIQVSGLGSDAISDLGKRIQVFVPARGE